MRLSRACLVNLSSVLHSVKERVEGGHRQYKASVFAHQVGDRSTPSSASCDDIDRVPCMAPLAGVVHPISVGACPVKKRASSFECFPCVCPEPVLANVRVSGWLKWRDKDFFFLPPGREDRDSHDNQRDQVAEDDHDCARGW
jgi:hypothetical protein